MELELLEMELELAEEEETTLHLLLQYETLDYRWLCCLDMYQVKEAELPMLDLK